MLFISRHLGKTIYLLLDISLCLCDASECSKILEEGRKRLQYIDSKTPVPFTLFCHCCYRAYYNQPKPQQIRENVIQTSIGTVKWFKPSASEQEWTEQNSQSSSGIHHSKGLACLSKGNTKLQIHWTYIYSHSGQVNARVLGEGQHWLQTWVEGARLAL